MPMILIARFHFYCNIVNNDRLKFIFIDGLSIENSLAIAKSFFTILKLSVSQIVEFFMP